MKYHNSGFFTWTLLMKMEKVSPLESTASVKHYIFPPKHIVYAKHLWKCEWMVMWSLGRCLHAYVHPGPNILQSADVLPGQVFLKKGRLFLLSLCLSPSLCVWPGCFAEGRVTWLQSINISDSCGTDLHLRVCVRAPLCWGRPLAGSSRQRVMWSDPLSPERERGGRVRSCVSLCLLLFFLLLVFFSWSSFFIRERTKKEKKNTDRDSFSLMLVLISCTDWFSSFQSSLKENRRCSSSPRTVLMLESDEDQFFWKTKSCMW